MTELQDTTKQGDTADAVVTNTEAADQASLPEDHPARSNALDAPAEPEQQPIEAEAAQATRDAFAAEHEKQLQAQRDQVIADAGESTNIGTDGQPHFLRLTPKDGVDVSGDEHNPDDFNAVCGGCGQPWPCPEGREIENVQRRALGMADLPAEDAES